MSVMHRIFRRSKPSPIQVYPAIPMIDRKNEPRLSSQASPTVPPLDKLMMDFVSLGDNCEFGLVQRFCGTVRITPFQLCGHWITFET